MNPIIEAQLKSFADFFSYSNLTLEEKFERYAIYCVVSGREGLDAPHNYFHLEGTEFGIDGVGITFAGEPVDDDSAIALVKKINDAEIWFFQVKTSSNLNYGSICVFFDAVLAFFKDEHIEGAGKDIEDMQVLKDLLFDNAGKLSDNPKLNLHFVYTGTGEISQQIGQLISNKKKELSALSLFSEIRVVFSGATNLQKSFRRATEASSANFSFKNKMTLPEHEGVSEAFLGYISAEELLKIVTIDGVWKGAGARVNRKLFFDNVRDYDPESDVNKSIGESIDLDGGGFVFRNNGVTIVARSGRPTGDNFQIKDFQIVNGCQTSNVIFEFRESAIENVKIPLRLIISNDNMFMNSIILGTNSQNPVKMEQFWALKEFLKNFEEFVKVQAPPRNLYFERRENQFNFEDVPERTRIVDPAALLKSVVAMFCSYLTEQAEIFVRQRKSSTKFYFRTIIISAYTMSRRMRIIA